jgi:hypothetical protein
LPKRKFRNPRRIGRGLRGKLRGVEPHSRGGKILSRGGSKLISKKIMLMPIPFLVPEVEEEAEEELSCVLRVENMVTNPLTVQRGR